MSIALTILELLNLAGAAYYRAGLFAVHGILSLVVIGAWVDREPLDIKLAIGFGIAAFVVDLFTAVYEISRAVQCANGGFVTAVDQNICLGESSLYYVNTIFAIVFTLGALLQVIVNFAWLGRINAALAARTQCGVLQQKARLGVKAAAERILFAGQKHAMKLKAQTITEYHLGAPWLATAHKAIGVIGAIIFVAATVLQMIDMYEVAFYRTVLLLVAAHAIGSSLSAFGAVPTYWPWIILVLSLLGGASSLVAVIVEITRQARCGAPIGVYEATICATSGWQAYIVPVEATIVFVLMLLSVVFSIWSLVTARRLRIASKTSSSVAKI